MSLFTSWTSQHPHVFRSLVVLGLFLLIFLAYYKSDMKFPALDFHMERGNYSCPTVVCENRAKTQEPNCSTQLQVTQDHKDPVEVQSAPVDTEPDTIVLIWLFPFGNKFDLSCSRYNITKCQLTDDRSLYPKAHGVIFHHRDIHGDLGNMPTEPRPWFQKWVWFNMESPANSNQASTMNNLFNLTCNYRLDSSIPVPYGVTEPVTSGEETFKLPAKDKLVCWIVSNWNPTHRRSQFYNELKKHIKVETYGSAFGRHVNGEVYAKLVSGCKFYLSFENSVYKDYITEKCFRPMTLGTVPIVLGPSRQTYEDHIPGDSFIHVDDFASPKELADRIQYLDTNTTEYMRYFDWKQRYKVRETQFGPEHACRTCSYIRNNRGYRCFHDFNKWYWG